MRKRMHCFIVLILIVISLCSCDQFLNEKNRTNDNKSSYTNITEDPEQTFVPTASVTPIPTSTPFISEVTVNVSDLSKDDIGMIIGTYVSDKGSALTFFSNGTMSYYYKEFKNVEVGNIWQYKEGRLTWNSRSKSCDVYTIMAETKKKKYRFLSDSEMWSEETFVKISEKEKVLNVDEYKKIIEDKYPDALKATPTPTISPTPSPTPSPSPSPTPKPVDCKLLLDIDFNANILLDKYSVNIYVDNKKVDTMEHGTYYIGKVDLKSGEHKISFAKRGDESISGSKTITLVGDSTFKCRITSHGSYVEIENDELLNYLESTKREMPDLTEMRLDAAGKKLADLGFVNIKTKSSSSIIIQSHWIVTAQNISAGKEIERTTEIILTCVKDG